MKSCPACHRTFEDGLTFCLVDGAVLSAPYDPQATQRIPEPRLTNSPATELLPSNAAPNNPDMAPTVISPPLQPTQPYVPPEFTPPSNERVPDGSGDNDNPLGRIIVGSVMGMVIGTIIMGISGKDPRDAILPILFFGLIGAIVGKFSSSLVRMSKNSRNSSG